MRFGADYKRKYLSAAPLHRHIVGSLLRSDFARFPGLTLRNAPITLVFNLKVPGPEGRFPSAFFSVITQDL